jgi:hypothetical protein
MQKGGFHLRFTSWSQRTILDAARALHPLPR